MKNIIKNLSKNKWEKVKLTTLAFTLIELLAVIIILAVIALISTPIVLRIVDQAKEGGRIESIRGYADAIKIGVFNHQLANEGKYPEVDATWANNKNNVVYDGDRVTCEEVKYDKKCGVILKQCNVGNNNKKYNYINKIVTTDDINVSECEITDDGTSTEEPTTIEPTKEECFIFDSGSYSITGYNYTNAECPSNVVIPNTIDGIPVSTIADNAFEANGLTSVNFSFAEDLYDIGSSAFANNPNLSGVIFPESLYSLGDYVFSGTNVTNVTIPSSVAEIGEAVFPLDRDVNIHIMNYKSDLTGEYPALDYDMIEDPRSIVDEPSNCGHGIQIFETLWIDRYSLWSEDLGIFPERFNSYPSPQNDWQYCLDTGYTYICPGDDGRVDENYFRSDYLAEYPYPTRETMYYYGYDTPEQLLEEFLLSYPEEEYGEEEWWLMNYNYYLHDYPIEFEDSIAYEIQIYEMMYENDLRIFEGLTDLYAYEWYCYYFNMDVKDEIDQLKQRREQYRRSNYHITFEYE